MPEKRLKNVTAAFLLFCPSKNSLGGSSSYPTSGLKLLARKGPGALSTFCFGTDLSDR